MTSVNPDDPSIVDATIIRTVTFNFHEQTDTVLKGFTIIGGIICDGASPTIEKNVIMNGFGISGSNSAAPTIANCTIINNERGISGCHGLIIGNTISNNVLHVGSGVGLSHCDGIVTNNIITNNKIETRDAVQGGALYACGGEISNNIITGNIIFSYPSGAYGGGLSNCNGSIYNNVISGNMIDHVGGGGGLFNCGGSIFNNTICGNIVPTNSQGGGLYLCDGIVKNNIIAFNYAGHGGGIYGECESSYNTFWDNDGGHLDGGASAGLGDVITHPRFVLEGLWNDNGTPGDVSDDFWIEGDYHLKSEYGRWDPNTTTWVLDDITSHCIDSGDPLDDVGQEPNPNGGRINMGAFGGTSQASKSPSGIINAICDNPPSMDTNADCKINIIDFAEFASQWMFCGLDIQEACWE